MNNKPPTPDAPANEPSGPDAPLLLIDMATANAILNYLARRPYIEVYQFVAALQQLPRAKNEVDMLLPAPTTS